jgi:hypothetical protein
VLVLGFTMFNPTYKRNVSVNQELGSECQTVLALINQLQLPTQQANILANLLTSAIYLQSHCDDDFQDLIATALETLPDTDEAE